MMQNYFSKTKLNEKKYLILGHGTFFMLFLFSIVLVKERVFFMDSAYQLFEMIQRNGFQQNVRRYSMFLSELLPLLAINLKLPLKVVVLSYSVSFTLLAYGFWLLTAYVLKNKNIAIIMLFTMIGIRQTFFHTISETFQLMFFAAFLYAWLNSRFAEKKEIGGKLFYYSIAIFMMLLCMFIHPVALFFLLFIAGIYILNKNYTLNQKIVISLITVCMLLLKFFTIEQGSHDTDYNISMREFINYSIHLYRFGSTKWFFTRFIDFYWIPCSLLTIALIQYKRQKQWLNFLFFGGFFLFFMQITLVLYHGSDSAIGRERSFLPLMFFCGVPFMRDVFPNLSFKKSKLFFIGLTCLIIGGYIKIAVASIPYSKRLQKIDEIVVFAHKENQKKLVMDKEMSHTIFPFYNWATGFESMMYSAIIHADSTVNFYIEEDIDSWRGNDEVLNEDFYMAVPWWTFWKIEDLNTNYFKLPKQQVKELIVDENGEFVIKDL